MKLHVAYVYTLLRHNLIHSRTLLRASELHIPARDLSSSLNAISSYLLDHSFNSPASILLVWFIHHLRASIKKEDTIPTPLDHVLVQSSCLQCLVPGTPVVSYLCMFSMWGCHSSCLRQAKNFPICLGQFTVFSQSL